MVLGWLRLACVGLALGAVAACAGHRPAPAAPGGSGATLRDIDGGPTFFSRFADPLPTDPSFFPLGVWVQRVTGAGDTAADRAAGINTYVGLTSESDPRFVRSAGMWLIADRPSPEAGGETVGWMLADEVDMWAGPGSGAWSGHPPDPSTDPTRDRWPVCQSPSVACGYTVQSTLSDSLPDDRRMRYANYGNGVVFWETNTQAGRFVNEFQDLISADTYWFTDPTICEAGEGERLVGGGLPPQRCRRAVNYGRTVDRLRSLVRPAGSRPVWLVVELGHPTRDPQSPTITPDQVRAAVWSAVIHGARGIVYFGYSAGGACPTVQALRDPCYAATTRSVTSVNSAVRALAPVLNSSTVEGVLTEHAEVDALVKWSRDHFYVLAQSTATQTRDAVLRMPCVGDAEVTVLDEDRQLSARGGVLTDTFAPDGVHLYRVDGGSSCGLR